MAQGCKKDLDILQLAQAQGMDPPSHHFEERTFKMIRYVLLLQPLFLPLPISLNLGVFGLYSWHFPLFLRDGFLSWFVLFPCSSVSSEDQLRRNVLLKKSWQVSMASWSGSGSGGAGMLGWMHFFVFIFSQDIFWTQQHRNAPSYCQGDKPTSSARYESAKWWGLLPWVCRGR